MTDTLKTLKQDKDIKAKKAQELHAQWQEACIEAKAANGAYLKAKRFDVEKTRTKYKTAPVEPHSLVPMTDGEIAELEALITSDSDEPEYTAGWWMKVLIGQYRCGGGYPVLTCAMLSDSSTERIELCHLIAALVHVIEKQDRANLDALRLMTNRNGKNTTPGVKERIAVMLRVMFGEDFDTKSETEKHEVIQSIMNGWPLELSFQTGCEIMRNWALLEFEQRRSGGKATQPCITKATKEKIREEYSRSPDKSVQAFCDRLSNEGWSLPDKRTVERYTKDLRQTK